MTLAELANESGLSRRQVWAMETGQRRRIQEETLVNLCRRALRCTRETLLSPGHASGSRPGQADHRSEEVSTGGPPRRNAGSRLKAVAVISTAVFLAVIALLLRNAPIDVRLERSSDGHSVYARNIWGRTLWRHDWRSKVEFAKITPWKTCMELMGLLDPDAGILCMSELSSGKELWRDDFPEDAVREVYGDEMALLGRFGGRGFQFGDIDGDSDKELAVYYVHDYWYPSYIRIYDKEGRILGTHWEFGHISTAKSIDLDGDGKWFIVTIDESFKPVSVEPTNIFLDWARDLPDSLRYVTSKAFLEDWLGRAEVLESPDAKAQPDLSTERGSS
jgi:DNA-binding Xre family transcriptional regulator